MYAENAVEIETELAAKQAELTALDAIIAGLPEGELQDENIKKRKRAEYSIFLLTDRKANYGVVALLEKEYDLQRVLQELEETQMFINEVETEKALSKIASQFTPIYTFSKPPSSGGFVLSK